MQSGPVIESARKIIEASRLLQNVVGLSVVVDAASPREACEKAAIACEDHYRGSHLYGAHGVYSEEEGGGYSIIYGPLFFISEVGFIYPIGAKGDTPQLLEEEYTLLFFPDIISEIQKEKED